MLLQFYVTNYKSIREQQLFTLLADKSVKENPASVIISGNSNALSSAIIYGRNASGKSNLLKALRALQFMVLASADFKVGSRIQTYEPYMLDMGYREKPVEFKIEFIAADHIKYSYEVGFLSNAITYERLYYYPKSQPAKLFERDGLHIVYGERVTGRKKDIEETLYDNQLYLSKVGSDKLEALYFPFHFFSNILLNFEDIDSRNEEAFVTLFTERMRLNGHFAANLVKLVKAMDTSILSFSVNPANIDPKSLPENMTETEREEFIRRYSYSVRTRHKIFKDDKEAGEIDFRLGDESVGTGKLLVLGGIILGALAEGQVLIIDELDNSLHPKITKALVRLFNDPVTNPKKAQLIFTTHEVSLLDNELFRRDQIWLAEKEYQGYSHYYTLSDIAGIRKDIPLEKWYMNGRFGATPVINEYDLHFEF
jgi:AAA15 family ATPase/GTPase